MKKTIFACVFAWCFFIVAPLGATEATTLHERAKNLYDVQDYRAALNLYGTILKQSPEDGLALDLSAWCLRYLGDLKLAESFFQKALKVLKPEDALWAHIGLGETYLDGNLYGEALTVFEAVLSSKANNDETHVRALKGKVLTLAMQGHSYEESMNLLQKLDAGEAAQTVAKIKKTAPQASERDGAEKTKKQSQKEPSQAKKSTLSDTNSRQQEIFSNPDENAKPDSQSEAVNDKASSKKSPKKSATKPRDTAASEKVAPSTRIYGIALGTNADKALLQARESGLDLVGVPFTREGKLFYTLKGFSSSLPVALREDIVTERLYLTIFNEGVLSVIQQIDYGRERHFEELKAVLLDELPNLIGSSRGLKTNTSVFSYEAGQARSNTYGTWIRLTDKMNGSCVLEVEHVDLKNLSHYWMSSGRQ